VRFAFAICGAALALGAGPGFAGWQPTGSGVGSARAKVMPSGPGATPTASVSSHDVTVSWAASTFVSGGNVPSYVVKRYDTVLGTAQAVLAGCSGLVSGTSCVESGVPSGTWKYSITPAAGPWLGTEGARSTTVVVTV
jgi:hypothetical protein